MATDRKHIWLSGQLIEVTEEVYEAYTKGERKIRYFESDLKTERIILDTDGREVKILPSREDSLDRLMADCAMQFPDTQESVESTVLRKLSIERLYRGLDTLPEKERQLIDALFFEGLTEREYAQELGVYWNSVHYRKCKILAKLRRLLE